MMKTRTLMLAVLIMMFSLSPADLLAQGKNPPGEDGQLNEDPPFLITRDLPHFAKLLIQKWDSPELRLSMEQKAELLVVRKETMGGAQKLGREIAAIENQVIEGIFSGKTPNELHALVQTIAGLKAEATMIHLQCIFDTEKILDQQQLDVLKQR